MAINSARIAGQPVTHIAATVGVRPIPPWYKIGSGLDSNGFPKSSDPDFEGQVYWNMESVVSGFAGSLFVAVNIEGALTWIPVGTGTAYNRYSGKEWNALDVGEL